MVTKILLAIFTFIAGVIMQFAPAPAHAADAYGMEWYDSQIANFPQAPSRSAVLSFLNTHKNDRIYMIPTYDGMTTAVGNGPNLRRSMVIMSMPVATTLTINGDKPFSTYYEIAWTYNNPVVGQYCVLQTTSMTADQVGCTPTNSTTGWSAGQALTGIYHGSKFFPPVIEIDVTNAAFGNATPVSPLLDFYPLDRKLWGNPITIPIFLRTTTYAQLSITVDGVYKDTLEVPSPSPTLGQNTDITDLVKDAIASKVGQHEIVIKAWKTVAKTDTPLTQSIIVTYTATKPVEPAPDPTEDPEFPVQPTAPDSAWDLVGWVSYIVDWVVYLVKTFTYLLSQLITSMDTTLNTFEPLKGALSSVFSFLPAQVTAVIMLALTVSVVLRFMGR